MSESDPTGYRESPDTTDPQGSSDPRSAGNMVDGAPGQDQADAGERDTTLTTDDDAQRSDEATRPGNVGS